MTLLIILGGFMKNKVALVSETSSASELFLKTGLKKAFSIIGVAMFIFLPECACFADWIFTKDGKTVECAIIQENDSVFKVELKDKRRIDIKRSDVVRVSPDALFRQMSYIYCKDGTIIEGFVVDEDRNSYTYRTVLDSPKEIHLSKKDVHMVSFEKVDVNVITPTGYYLRGMVPGWGQYYADQTTKGLILWTSFMASGMFLGWSYVNYTDKRSIYRNIGPGNDAGKFDRSYNDYKKSGLYLGAGIAAFGIVYIANWIDLLYFTQPKYGTRLASQQSEPSAIDIVISMPATADKRGAVQLGLMIRF
jgi:hypothetical protein